jgi:hypothetical protein
MNYISSYFYGGIYEENCVKLFSYEYVEKLAIGNIYHNCILLSDWGLYKKGDKNDEILISNF